MKKVVVIVFWMICILLNAQQDNLIFSVGKGDANVGERDFSNWDFRISAKNNSTILIIDYTYLENKDKIDTSDITDEVTDTKISDINFMVGKCLPFGSYSNLNISTGIGIVFVTDEYNKSYPRLPEEKSKDLSFPISSSINIRILKYFGLSVHAKKSFNDLENYFSYSISLDLIF